MAAITAADVNKLRTMTGAGMMDCKKALTEADGDFEAARDILRKQGQKIADKRADNATSEGLVLVNVSDDGTTGTSGGPGLRNRVGSQSGRLPQPRAADSGHRRENQRRHQGRPAGGQRG
ncbi:MAG: hypothetical protein WKG07_07080 [Hymenobacter sp.]